MQDISYRLFEGAYTSRPRAEQRMMGLAFGAMALQAGLLLYLVVLQTFTHELVAVFLLNLFVPAYFIFSIWLDHRPQYRRHLTLNATGVRYRTRFMQPEHEFDWEEIDSIKLKLFNIKFILKNGEVHEVSLERIQNDGILHQVNEQILYMARQKGLELH